MINIIASAIRFSTVFLYGSTGETLIEKSGQLNLGIPGIMCIGLVGGGTALKFCILNGITSPIIVFLLSVLCAMLFAGLAGALFGLFTITLKCNQNVTGLTITTFGIGILEFWGIEFGKTAISFQPLVSIFQTVFPNSEKLGAFGKLFLSYGPLVYLAIFIAVLMAIFLNKTKPGLHLRAVGENPGAADATGISVTKYRYFAAVIGAGIAGIGGLFFLIDYMRGAIEYVVDQMGWIAVALVIFSVWKPARGILGSIFFGFLYVLPNYYTFGIPKDIIMTIPYVVTLIVLIAISIKDSKESQPPAALGLSYFREER